MIQAFEVLTYVPRMEGSAASALIPASRTDNDERLRSRSQPSNGKPSVRAEQRQRPVFTDSCIDKKAAQSGPKLSRVAADDAPAWSASTAGALWARSPCSATARKKVGTGHLLTSTDAR